MAEKYYAVIKGKVEKPTIFTSWADCKKVTTGYSQAKFKSFKKYEDALKYIKKNCGKITPNYLGEKNNLEFFIDDFKKLSEENEFKVWNYVKRLKEQNKGTTKTNNYRHLRQFSQETRDLCIEVHQIYGDDLFSSLHAMVKNNLKMSIYEILEKYKRKYTNKRSYIIGKDNELKELIQFHYSNIIHDGIEAYPYLKIFNKDTQDFIIKVDDEFKFNLYHSVSAYYNNRMDKTANEVKEKYLEKYSNKRPYLNENIECVEELFIKMYEKLHG